MIAILSSAGVILSPEITYPKNCNIVLKRLHLAAGNLIPMLAIPAKIMPSALRCSARVLVKISKSSQYTYTNGNPLNIMDIALNNADEKCCAPTIILKNFHHPVKPSPLQATLLPQSA